MEAELEAFKTISYQAIWYRGLLQELGYGDLCIPVFGDNESTLNYVKDEELSSRTKHLKLKYVNIREAVDDHILTLQYVPTEDNLADALTKAVTGPKMLKAIKSWGMHILGECVKE